MREAERNSPDANIKTFGDGLWWAATTVTTVGYGDRFPTTPLGRLIAVVLMLVGIALLGVITATIATWFVGRLQVVEEEVAEVKETTTRRLTRFSPNFARSGNGSTMGSPGPNSSTRA